MGAETGKLTDLFRAEIGLNVIFKGGDDAGNIANDAGGDKFFVETAKNLVFSASLP